MSNTPKEYTLTVHFEAKSDGLAAMGADSILCHGIGDAITGIRLERTATKEEIQ